ncbi:MAG: hypothetical protein IJ418_00645 [Clostridia bacterium]|nr:hypothetical protein [Clostridia bacterium]
MKTYKVYARVDAAGRILAIDSDAFLPDPSGWVLIDEGTGDRYHHAQGNYLGPVMNESGVPMFKLVDGVVMRRTAAEMDAETMPAEEKPSLEERLAELEEQNEMLMGCILEMSEMVYA